MVDMADNKKETERAELHRTIWGIANDLRGSVDGWDFKQYVLGMLFYRYISENLDRYISKGEIEAGNKDFSYAKLSDKEALTAKDDIVKEKGFFILPSKLFGNVLEKANKDTTNYENVRYNAMFDKGISLIIEGYYVLYYDVIIEEINWDRNNNRMNVINEYTDNYLNIQLTEM